MDADRFDTFTKRLAGGRFSRRQAMRGVAATTAGVFLTISGRNRAEADNCRDNGVPCGKNAHCWSETCDSDSHRCTGGNSGGARFCKAVFPPGPDRGQCVSDGANGGGPCDDGTGGCAAGYTLCGSDCIPNDRCCGNTSCSPGQTCIDGACKDGQGTACTDGGTCASNLCVDGVCCDRACTDQCEACGVTGSAGTCIVMSGAPHGARPACAGTPPCGGTCDGAAAGCCAYPGNDTSCGTPTGSDNSSTAYFCTGGGACGGLTVDNCLPYT